MLKNKVFITCIVDGGYISPNKVFSNLKDAIASGVDTIYEVQVDANDAGILHYYDHTAEKWKQIPECVY